MVDESKKTVLSNEGAYTVHLVNPNTKWGNRSLIVPPRGKLVIDYGTLRDCVYALPGNKEIISDYLTIKDADIRYELGIDSVPVVDDEKINTMLHLTSGIDIKEKLEPFLKELGPGQLDRVAQMAIDQKISDMRIMKLLEKYTPYKSIGQQINDSISIEDTKEIKGTTSSIR